MLKTLESLQDKVIKSYAIMSNQKKLLKGK